MRLPSCISVLLCPASLTLSLLCLLAGSKFTFLEDTNILTLNLSGLAKELLANGTSNANSASSDATSLVEAYGIHDWYSMHVMNYCEGSYSSYNTKTNGSCSGQTPFFYFNPINIMDSQFNTGTNVSVLGVHLGIELSASGWPSQITNALKNSEGAYKFMFFMLCMGIAAIGVELIVSLVVFIIDRRIMSHGTSISFINLGLTIAGFLGIGVASAINTSIMVTVVNTINSQGSQMGMMAEKGDKFLWMSWAATVIIFVDVLIWIIDYFDERSMRGLVPYNSYVDNRGYESELKSIKAETKEINAINKAARKAAKAERAPMTMATIPTRRPRGVIGPAVGEVSRRGITHLVGDEVFGPNPYVQLQEPPYSYRQNGWRI